MLIKMRRVGRVPLKVPLEVGHGQSQAGGQTTVVFLIELKDMGRNLSTSLV